MKLICPNCGTAHDSTYLHPSMKELICKICDTEFPIDNKGWEDTLPVKYRPPENSDIRLYWEGENFVEVVLPPEKPHWFWTTVKVLGGSIGAYWGFVLINAIINTFADTGMWLWAWFCVSVLIFWGLQWVYKNMLPFTEYQKIRINKEEIRVDKVNLFHQTSDSFKVDSADVRTVKDEKKGDYLELVDYKEATRILERLSKEEQEWSKEMLTKVLEEVKRT